MKHLLTPFSVFVFAVVASAQFTPGGPWERAYGGANDDEARAVLQTEDGGYIVTGYTRSFGAGGSDMYLVRTNNVGDPIWTQTYGGVADDGAEAMCATSDGGYLLAGYTRSFGAGGSDMYVIKVDGVGFAQWSRTYGGIADDGPYSVSWTNGGAYVISGYAGPNMYVVKIDGSGDTLWTRTFGRGTYGDARVKQVSDGGFLVVGSSLDSPGPLGMVHFIKMNSNGDTLWTSAYAPYAYASFPCPGAIHLATAEETQDGGYVVGGEFWGTDCDESLEGVTYMIRTDQAGTFAWGSHYLYTDIGRMGGLPTVHSIIQTLDGGFIMAGSYNPRWEYVDAVLVRTDGNGTQKALGYYRGRAPSLPRETESQSHAYSVRQTTDHGYIAAGYTNGMGAGGKDFFLFKTGTDQNLPVSLTTFSASPSTDGIRLNFALASETDNDHFEIWRSTTREGSFAKIAQIRSQGNSASGHNYEYVDRAVTAGQTYWYYLADVDVSGNRTEHRNFLRSATFTGANAIPTEFALSSFPNPFNPTTTILLSLPEAGVARVAAFDVTGRRVRDVFDGNLVAGAHRFTFDAGDLPAGVYFVRAQAGSRTLTEKVLLLK